MPTFEKKQLCDFLLKFSSEYDIINSFENRKKCQTEEKIAVFPETNLCFLGFSQSE